MHLIEKEIEIKADVSDEGLLFKLKDLVRQKLNTNEYPVRFVITKTKKEGFECELGTLVGFNRKNQKTLTSIFEFRRRQVVNHEPFNVVLIIPTGIGAELGGHSGDAGALARTMAKTCDTLITHPNVVNAADLNELPDNGLYVEGSIITRFLMGTVGLQKVRSNRVLVIIEEHEDESFTEAAVNSVSAARVALGLSCLEIVRLSKKLKMVASYSSSGRSMGTIQNMEGLLDVLDSRKGQYDAVAITSFTEIPENLEFAYYAGDLVNPWGGAEALLTHTLSLIFNLPSAHSPLEESDETLLKRKTGIVDPRKAAETVSISEIHCILKGLHRSPLLITQPELFSQPGILSVEDVHCLVIPDCCVGLPTLAALEQNIPVIAVRENKNLMKNDLSLLPWKKGQLHVVENYWEAVGVLTALKAGIAPDSVRRPLKKTQVTKESASSPKKSAADEKLPLRSSVVGQQV